MGVFFNDAPAKTKVPLGMEVAQDGKGYMYAKAHSTLTVNTAYFISWDEYGPITMSLTDVDIYTYIGVADEAVTAGNTARLQVMGYRASLTTPSLSTSAGHALGIAGGEIVDDAADYSGLRGQFAVNVAATTSATNHQVQLTGNLIHTST